MGRFDRALADPNHWIHLDPKFALAHCNRSAAHRQIGKRDRAQTGLDQAIRLDPKLVRSICNLGNLLADAGRDDLVQSYPDRFLAAFPTPSAMQGAKL